MEVLTQASFCWHNKFYYSINYKNFQSFYRLWSLESK